VLRYLSDFVIYFTLHADVDYGTWHPSSSSVSMARFVTAGAI
jgi:hypothetical protein